MNDTQRKWLVVGGIAVLVAALGAGGYALMGGKQAPAKKPPKISLIPTTPPPPPPPPKEEKRPEPPKEQKEVKTPSPPKEAPPAPAAPALKMEGPAGDSPGGLQAGAVTNDGVGSLGGTPGGGGGEPTPRGINPFDSYATQIQSQLQRFLKQQKELRQVPYRIEVRLWVTRDGHLSRHELVGSTGDTDTDAALRAAMTNLGQFTQGPPEHMPQPIRLRLSAGGR
jgi:protein TonB